MGNRHGEVIAGAVLGGVIVGLSSLLISSKKGAEVTQDFSQKIDDYRDSVEEYITSINDNIEGIEDKAIEWSDKVRGTIEHVKEEVSGFAEKDHRELYIGLLIGAIVGGTVGAGSARLFSGKVDDQLLNDMLSKVGVGASSLHRVIRDISDTLEEKQGRVKEREPRANPSARPSQEPVNDVIDFALSGLQLWRKLSRS
jgi:gas vesicle protein